MSAFVLLLTALISSPPATSLYSSVNTSPLEAIVSIASKSRLPIGIVTRSEGNSFCSPKPKISVSARDPREAIAKIAEQAGYHWADSPKVLLLLPKDVTRDESHILDLDIGDLSPPAASTRVLGGFLLARMQGTLHPEKGVAGDILSAPKVKTVQFNMGPHATPEKVANKLVSADVPGLWIMTFMNTLDDNKTSQKTEAFQDLAVYSYDDDAVLLTGIKCRSHD